MRKSGAERGRNIRIRLLVILLPAVVLTAAMSQKVFAKTYGTEGDRNLWQTAQTPGEEYAVRIVYHGRQMDVISRGETVEQLLRRSDLTVGETDRLSLGLTEETFPGLVLRVDRVVKRQETFTSTLPHETAWCDDSSIPAGSREILTRGVDGELKCTAEVTYINGVEAKREILGETMTIAPVTQVIARGTGEAVAEADPYGMPVIGDGYIQLPTGEVLTYTKTDTVRATAYTHTDAGCDRITATGTTVRRGTVAVDPRFIPYGTRMFVVSNDGEYVYGLAVAEDCGGAIKRDRMDLYFPTHEECIDFGRRSCTIYFLG